MRVVKGPRLLREKGFRIRGFSHINDDLLSNRGEMKYWGRGNLLERKISRLLEGLLKCTNQIYKEHIQTEMFSTLMQ
ncbi:hypothetical protein V7201_06475 [Bacillus sp. JJ1122]